MNKIRVLIADDHTLFRTGVRKVLEAEEDMMVVGEAATGREALEQARTLTPDIILMDIKMPDPNDSAGSGKALDGIEATRILCREMPQVGIIFVTMFEDDEFIVKGLQAGGRGYILKDSDPDTMLRAVRAVARGESLLGPTIAQKALRQFSVRPDRQPPAGGLLLADRFEINNLEQDLLGRGGMGDIYRATDIQTGESVAVKALNSDLVADDPGILERFVREGQALRQLNHPNIVKMLAAVEQEGRHYLVMEYVEGGSLQDMLAAQGPLPSLRVVQIALDLADALTRAHRLGIIHRDLKPANVLLAKDGTPRLADLGIAHIKSGQRLTQTGVLIGTIDYLSPEVCQGQPPDERADIWAFGVMLFELLAGRLPFEAQSLAAKLTAILTQPVPDLAQLAPDVPVALTDLVYRMLAKDPQQRISSVRLVGAELEVILKGRESTPAQPARTDKLPVGTLPSSSVFQSR